MQSVKFAKVSESDIAFLFGRGPSTIRAWVRAGMPKIEDGTFSLPAVIRWREQQHTAELAEKLSPDRLSPKELVVLLGVSRQSLSSWGRAGLKPGRSGYSLPAVLQWLRHYYNELAGKKYQKRLRSLRKKLQRNIAQIEKFLSRA
jgi:phage terminase Nu1 subunit (DNA packaging protein)